MAFSAACSSGPARQDGGPGPTPSASVRTDPSTPPPLATPTTQVAASSAALAARLQAVVRGTPDECAVVSLDDRVAYQLNPDAAVVPASVTKLLTAAASLDVIGSGTRFTTAVRGVADTAGIVQGDLWIVGGGDPVLATDAWARRSDQAGRLRTSLDTLADRVRAAGVRSVRGRVVADETRYDSIRTVGSWPQRLVEDGEIGPLSALVANDGFRVAGHPGVPFSNPALGTANLFVELLERRGIEVGTGPPGSGKAPDGPDLASITSPTVGDLTTELLRESDNGTAELLVKEVGLRRYGTGSTAAGARAVAAALGDRGVPLANTVVADGSGLSSDARVTCRALVALLAGSEPVLRDRLAVAGRSGTLRDRFLGTAAAGRIRAKTGSLDGMAGLAGYADTVAGQRVAFAYIANGLAIPTTARSVQDPFVLALVTARV